MCRKTTCCRRHSRPVSCCYTPPHRAQSWLRPPASFG
ncbi:hypothetical protein BCB71_12415 [Tannerella serpentiformis]|nr:hypothetical protein BCB71_12415 [Tannerella serpentiformis]RKW65433.1 MAG: hypothetical protein D8B51_05805 [Tannerella sp.]